MARIFRATASSRWHHKIFTLLKNREKILQRCMYHALFYPCHTRLPTYRSYRSVRTPPWGVRDPFFGQNDQKKGLAKMAQGGFWPFLPKIRGFFRIGEKDPPLAPKKSLFGVLEGVRPPQGLFLALQSQKYGSYRGAAAFYTSLEV